MPVAALNTFSGTIKLAISKGIEFIDITEQIFEAVKEIAWGKGNSCIFPSRHSKERLLSYGETSYKHNTRHNVLFDAFIFTHLQS